MTAPTPPIPTFTDGLLVHQPDLNAMSTHLNALYAADLGGFRTNVPACAVRLTTTKAIPNNTETQIIWDVADINTDGMWTVSSPTTLTVNTAGVWLITTTLGLVNGTAAQIAARILVNGTNSPTDGQVTSSQSGSRGVASAFVALAAGSVINATIFHTVGSTTNLDLTKGSCRLSAWRVSL